MKIKNKVVVGIGMVGILGSSLLVEKLNNDAVNAMIVLNEYDGLPKWPITYLVDQDSDGIPDHAIDYLVGLGPFPYKNVREPTQAEVENYSQKE